MIRKAKNFYHRINASISNAIFLYPGKKLKVIGVTGTDGKTTTVNLIYHILKENGKSVSMLTSIGAVIGKTVYDTGYHVTTPSSYMLQKLLRKSVKEKSEFFVLEVTSHALDQYRVLGIPFSIGIVTNVTSEHLDYHKTYDNYLKTKEKLLKMSNIAIVNKDDASYTLFSESKNMKNPSNWVTYGFTNSSEVNLNNFYFESKNLLGDFNKYNVLAAAACCLKLGLSDNEIRNAIKTFKMPLGRVDYVYQKDYSVIIDFAHTPNAFEQLLSSLRKTTNGRIIHVFGSAGERDKAKRPFMGEISSKYSDILFLTAEDPRSENVDKIINDIESGIKKKDAKVFKLTNRKDAIEAAVEMAGYGDLVVITGKAHEKSMTYGNKETPWDEYKVVLDAIRTRK